MSRNNYKSSEIKLSDLSKIDKEKVSRLVHKLVSLGKEHEETVQLLANEKIKYENQLNTYSQSMEKNISIIEDRLKSKDKIISEFQSKQALYNGFIILYQAKLKNTSEAFRFYEIVDTENKIRINQLENDIQSFQSLIESQKTTIESFQSINELNNMESKMQQHNETYQANILLLNNEVQLLKDVIIDRDRKILQLQNKSIQLQNEIDVLNQERNFYKQYYLEHEIQLVKHNVTKVATPPSYNNDKIIEMTSSLVDTTTNKLYLIDNTVSIDAQVVNNNEVKQDYALMYNTPNDSFNLSFDSIQESSNLLDPNASAHPNPNASAHNIPLLLPPVFISDDNVDTAKYILKKENRYNSQLEQKPSIETTSNRTSVETDNLQLKANKTTLISPTVCRHNSMIPNSKNESDNSKTIQTSPRKLKSIIRKPNSNQTTALLANPNQTPAISANPNPTNVLPANPKQINILSANRNPTNALSINPNPTNVLSSKSFVTSSSDKNELRNGKKLAHSRVVKVKSNDTTNIKDKTVGRKYVAKNSQTDSVINNTKAIIAANLQLKHHSTYNKVHTSSILKSSLSLPSSLETSEMTNTKAVTAVSSERGPKITTSVLPSSRINLKTINNNVNMNYDESFFCLIDEINDNTI